jgi:hypothetical protein
VNIILNPDKKNGIFGKIFGIFNRKSSFEEKYLFYEDFKDDVLGDPPSNWLISTQGGEIYVHKGVSMEKVARVLVISSPKGSDDHISLQFPRLRSLYLSYEFRQDYFRGEGSGAGLSLFSDSKLAVWLGIRSRGLYYSGEAEKYDLVTPVVVGEWYKIILHLDCALNECSIRVNDKIVLSGKTLGNEVEYVNKVASTRWVNEENWQTSINNILVNGLQY